MSVAPLIRQLAPRFGIDPRAAIAVALGEGGLQNRTNDIGDLAGGGSYGPFQLYAKGALPAQYRGNPAAADAWAWSPQGITYALSKMKEAGASGLTGARAVEAIIRKFERPYDPDKSVRNALARLGAVAYGGGGSRTPVAPVAARTPAPVPYTPSMQASTPAAGLSSSVNPRRSALLSALMSGGDVFETISRLPSIPMPTPQEALYAPTAPRSTAVAPQARQRPRMGLTRALGTRAGGGFAPPVELFHDPLGGIKYGRQIGAIGGHDKHVHYASKTPQEMLRAISLAKQLGLSVRENPYVDPVDPVHTKNSYHYRTFPGTYNGRQLGMGIDVSGPRMTEFYRRLARMA